MLKNHTSVFKKEFWLSTLYNASCKTFRLSELSAQLYPYKDVIKARSHRHGTSSLAYYLQNKIKF